MWPKSGMRGGDLLYRPTACPELLPAATAALVNAPGYVVRTLNGCDRHQTIKWSHSPCHKPAAKLHHDLEGEVLSSA